MGSKLKILLILLISVFLIALGFYLGSRQKANNNVLSAQGKNNIEIPTISASPTPNLSPDLYKVAKVVDGDTLDVYIDGKSRAVRLIGIDTPEVVDPRKPVQCFGKEASDKAKSILTGQSVRLESDPTQGDLDKYKRLLRYVFLEDGTNFNLMMISQGFAHEYTYNLPYKYQAQFKDAEKEARDKNLGLWNPNSCNGNTSSGNFVSPSDASPTQITASDYKPTGTYTCDCSKLCGAIKTCDEAYYQLQNCGCSARDSDGDGVPCESLCN